MIKSKTFIGAFRIFYMFSLQGRSPFLMFLTFSWLLSYTKKRLEKLICFFFTWQKNCKSTFQDLMWSQFPMWIPAKSLNLIFQEWSLTFTSISTNSKAKMSKVAYPNYWIFWTNTIWMPWWISSLPTELIFITIIKVVIGSNRSLTNCIHNFRISKKIYLYLCSTYWSTSSQMMTFNF